jgi:hypothetical protein
MSPADGVVWAVYHGYCWRRRVTSAGPAAERAYQVMSRVWIPNPDGTVCSTAFWVGLRASPVPRSCFPAALEGSMGHRQEYRSAIAAGAAAVSRLKGPGSYGLREAGSRTRTCCPGAGLKQPYYRAPQEAICTFSSLP